MGKYVKFQRILSLVLALVLLVALLPQVALPAGAEGNKDTYKGKVISIMGASIDTFAGWIPTADGFNAEHRARYPDTSQIPDVTTVEQTWWHQLITELDAQLGVNDSWAGSGVYWGENMSVQNGDTGEKAAMASLTRIQNLGANGTPDVILFHGGGNDMTKNVKVGSFDPATAPAEVDLVSTQWDSFADAYVDAIMRMQYYYPDALIVAMLQNPSDRWSEAHRMKYVNVMEAVCRHYGVACVYLENSGITLDNLPDGVHPDDEGMDFLTNATLEVLYDQCEMEPGENVVYPVTHDLTNAQASLHYYKGVSAGKAFTETISGENVTVTVTMGGKDITAECYSDGVISIPNVTGELVITAKAAFNADGHLQQLPEDVCAATNLWNALEPEKIYYTVSGWGNTSAGNSWSITFPVVAGERVWATSFGAYPGNGSTANGTRITWFDENGLLETLDRNTVYKEFKANGYITVPEGATALNVPMTGNKAEYAVYLLDRGHNYADGSCTACGKADEYADWSGKVISILSASTSTFAGYIPVADGFNLAHRARYPQDNLLTDVNETWWMQVITELDAKLGINDSWAGSQVTNMQDTNSGDLGPDAAMASLTRIQNLGANGTPDMILVYAGGNDMGRGVTLGSFDPATAPTQVDLTTRKWNSFADAYVTMIMRLKHFYPDTQIVVMTSHEMPSYVTAAKLNKYGPVIRAICDHYDVPYIDLRDCGITFDMLPDNIHPNAEGMDYITRDVIDTLFDKVEMEPGENVVYPVTHDLTNAQASLHYYKGVSAGKAFTETISGENVTVTVTMGGEDITAECYSDGVISIPNVTGELVITAKAAFNADGHLQQLPENVCAGTNLWTALEPENIYYTVSGWGLFASSPDVHSITFPVTAGERVWATSFQAAGANGASANATRITWFDENGLLKTVDRDTVYAEFAANGYITVPEGATALNVPMVGNKAGFAVYLLDRGHSYGNWVQVTAPTCDAEGQDKAICTVCGETIFRDTRISGDPNKILVSNPVAENYFEGKTILCLGDSLTNGTGVEKEERYHALMGAELGATIRPGGVSGGVLCTGGHLPERFQCMTAEYLTKNKVDVVTVFLGINDWDNGVVNGTYQGKLKYDPEETYYDLGEFGTDDTSTIYGAARMWCERIQELRQTEGCEHIEFVFATPVITSYNKSVTNKRDWDQDKVNVFGYTLRQYCAAIMEVCAYYDVPVLDLNVYSGMYYHSEADNNVSYFGGDGIHPGVNGHRMMADAFVEFLTEGYTYEERTVADCGHSYETAVTQPTCTEQGYTTHRCPECYYSYVDAYTDTVAHTPAEAVRENETQTGYDSVVYCAVCGAELSRETVETYLPGDINGDGKVNNKDATRLFQYLSGWEVEVVEAALDVNGDGKVNNKDATRLFQYLSGWEVEIH